MEHPLESFIFCPKCGAKSFVVHDMRSKRCVHCGFTLYHNASAATVAVVFDTNNRLLVSKRAFEPASGTLDLPGGFVDPDETIEEGLLREIAEETGATATIERYLFSLPNTYLYSDFIVHTVDMFFLCRLSDEKALKAQDDVAQLKWVALSDLQPSAFGLDSIRQGVERIRALDAQHQLF